MFPMFFSLIFSSKFRTVEFSAITYSFALVTAELDRGIPVDFVDMKSDQKWWKHAWCNRNPRTAIIAGSVPVAAPVVKIRMTVKDHVECHSCGNVIPQFRDVDKLRRSGR